MIRQIFLILGISALFTACGGGGGGGGLAGGPVGTATDDDLVYTPGEFLAPNTFKSLCEVPRTGASATTGEAFDDLSGSTLAENHWLRAWIHDTYLWFDEVPDLDPSDFDDPIDYFDLLKTAETTPSGKDKDEFHFTQNTADWEARSRGGVSVSYGLEFAVLSSTVPREVVVVITEPGLAADMAGVARGDRIVSIDGVGIDDDTDAGIDTLNDGLAPSDEGETHSFVFLATDGSTKTIDLTAEAISLTPVQETQVISTLTGDIGYMVFTDHIATSESLLIDAFAQLENAGVDDLVLDLRYNGGGFLAIAAQVAYMVADTRQTSGATFEQLQFNSKYQNTDPVTGQPNDPIPFYNESLGFSVSGGQQLPNLGLDRLFVIATGSTCSASESIINGLRGVGIDVILIGTTTCGKPFGFYATDNCGTTYFSVQFQSVNALGFGEYADGFTSAQQSAIGAVQLPGCLVQDDYDNLLGSPREAMLEKALLYQATGSCATGDEKLSKPQVLRDPAVIKPLWLQNRAMGLPEQPL